MSSNTQATGMLLHGMQAIADHLGMERRAAYHLAASGQIPTFKIGRAVCADRQALTAAIKARAAAVTPAKPE